MDISISPDELARRLTMSGLEVESVTKSPDDVVFDVAITPNRGDCLSVMGVAREAAAVTGRKFVAQVFRPANIGRPKGLRYEKNSSIKNLLSVTIKDKKRCPRYTAMAVLGLKIGPSPAFVQKRLEACGIRPINNVVDATNYMMLETGQPFHAFDHRALRGSKIIVRTAIEGEEFVTLDGVTRKLVKTDLLICDGEGAVALAGVMGGLNSEVRSDTDTVVLESASFMPVSVRKTAKRLALSSESSKRFERFVNPDTTLEYVKRLGDFIVKHCGGEATGDWIDVYPEPLKPLKIKFNIKEAEELIGIKLNPAACKKHLTALGVKCSGNIYIPPLRRPDLERSADLVEEIARLNGYDKIPSTLPLMTMSSVVRPGSFGLKRDVREYLTSLGFSEAINYGFCSPTEAGLFSKEAPVTISNPLGVEFSQMKPTLLTGLLTNLKFNISNGQDVVRLFELRPVFSLGQSGVLQRFSLAGIMSGFKRGVGWASPNAASDFFDIKGVAESVIKFLKVDGVKYKEGTSRIYVHPTASITFELNGEELGYAGQLHPEVASKWGIESPVYVFELDWERLAKGAAFHAKRFAPIEKFPVVRRDVALLVSDGIASERLINEAFNLKSNIIRSVFPFDVYKGKGIPDGKKSVAYAVLYSHPERTLTDEEVNDTHTRLVAYLKDKLGAEVR